MIQRDPVTSIASTGGIQRAQQLVSAGEAVQQFSNQRQKIKDSAADLEIAKKNSELNVRLNKSFNDLKKSFQNDPFKGQETFNGEIDNVINDVAGSMSEAAKDKFLGQSYKYADTYKIKSDNWANTQNTANIFTNYQESVGNYEQQFYAAGKDLDEESFTTAMASYTGNLGLYSSAIDPKQLQEFNERDKSKFVNLYLEGATRTDPTRAAQMLNSGQFDDFLNQQQKDELKNGILNQVLNNTNAELKTKRQQPYAYLATQGDPVAPIDMTNRQELSNSLMDRQEYVDTRTVQNGVDLQFLTPQEENQFMQITNSEDADTAIDFMTGLSLSTTNTSENKIAQQIAKKDAVAAAAFSMSGQNQQLAKDMIIGRQLLKDKSVAIDYKDKDMVAKIQDDYGDSIQDPVLLGQIVKATKAAYATSVYRGQSDNSDTYEDILKQVLGDSAEVNGYQTPTFIKDDGQALDSGIFEDLYEDMTLEQMEQTGQPKLAMPNELDNYKKYGRLLPVGNGQYNILMTTTNRFVADESGNVYTLDMKNLYDVEKAKEMNKLRQFFR